uniref:Protein SPT2 homolog n=1 Tax=Sphenodon punctatus TaxID=8508 RepID=A0A8D0L234_SPHPU
MDFQDILVVASEQQGVSNVPKRYSLAVGPPKKDPKVKGVQSTAVQAFLRRKEEEMRRKVLEEKRRKEGLLAKRVELKHDRKARAMASRTKDNFYGYNGIPIEEKPKKRKSGGESVDRGTDVEYATEDEAELFEYSQTESEHEPEEYEEKPARVSVKPKAPPKSAPAPMNFTDLLRLAEKKQYEPVEIKVVKKIEERPRTAEELREMEYLERKNKKVDALKEKKKDKEAKNVAAPGPSKKLLSQKEIINAKLGKGSTEKHSSSKGSLSSLSSADKKSKAPPVLNEKHSRSSSSSSKSNHIAKAKTAQNASLKSQPSGSYSKPSVSGSGKPGPSSHTPISKKTANGTQKLPPAKEVSLKKSISGPTKPASSATPQHESVKNSSSKRPGSHSGTGAPPPRPGNSSGVGPGRPSSSSHTGSGRPSTGPGRSCSSSAPGRQGSSLDLGPGWSGSSSSLGAGRQSSISGHGRPGSSSSTGPGRPDSIPGTGPGRPGNNTGTTQPASSSSIGPGRPGTSSKTGLCRGSNLGTGPSRPGSSSAATPKPKCTVVSETISSKNLVVRPSNGQMNGMRSLIGHRPVSHPQGLPRPSLPPISYKRHIEDEDDYDSEMEDFIDDEGEPQEEISKHIREIFGYDRNKYKDESDYALRYMESSWKEQQKEEARSWMSWRFAASSQSGVVF